jgi:hypothetical protein
MSTNPANTTVRLNDNTTILGIFFALALLCAVFFGFGYSLGRRSLPIATPAEVTAGRKTAPQTSSGSLAAQTIKLSAGATELRSRPLTSETATVDAQPSTIPPTQGSCHAAPNRR